jgi:hydroxyethylthiazole kinase-like uncharacterized protein yjeF
VRPVWTVEEVRAAEASSGVAEAVLIDRASTAVARRAAALLDGTYGRRVLVVAGPGHNGADALWAGVKLAARGVAVDVDMPYGEPRDDHGRAPLRLLGSRPPRGTYDLVIDGLLGVGARPGPVEWPWSGRVLAVDVPTGVDAATGAVSAGAVRADVTVTFGALKPGLVVGAGAECAGLVEVAAIGLSGDATTWVLDAADVAPYVTAPGADTDKYRRGVVGVVAGSERYPGAAMLACRGAQRAGCGYVRLVAPRAVADLVRASYPEVVAGDGRADVWVVGPGLGDDKDAVRTALATGTPAVIDADAIALVDRDALRPDVVLTPHTGEFERLTGVPRADAENDWLGHARRAAADLGCVVLLKGTTTVVAAPDGTAYVNPTGTPYLGTAGTGDVLSGVLGALLSRSADPAHAVAAAAWLHGLAGRLAAGDPAVAVTAIDVAEALPEAARVALRAC